MKNSTYYFSLSLGLLVGLYLTACGGDDGGARSTSTDGDTSGTPTAPPEISSFTATTTTITEGTSVTLTAVFSNGSGTIDNGIGEIISGASRTVSPMETTTFTLTVSNSAGVVVTSSVEITVEPTPPFILNIVSPRNNQLVGSDMEIVASIQSDLDISVVNAVVENRSVPLDYSSVECNGGVCATSFYGQLSFSNFTPGSYVLTVTAEDVGGNIVFAHRSFVLDSKPILTITEPQQLSVARPGLPVDVSCSDDVGDCEITVKVDTMARPNNQLMSAVNVLTDTLDLAAYDGQQITLNIQGKDSSSQLSVKSIAVYVESSANLNTVKDFSGRILDFDGLQALILESVDDGDRLLIYDLKLDTTIDVVVPAGLSVSSARSFLTPTGAIYTATPKGGSSLTTKIYDWNNSQLHDLGHPRSASSLAIAGDYAIWSDNTILWLRSFSMKTNTQVSTSAGNWENSVGSNGVVTYWTYPGYSIVRYDTGINTFLATGSEYENTWVVGDGYRFVYRKRTPGRTDRQYAIAYHDGTNETVLTNFREKGPNPGSDYQVNNGWIAFTELGGLGQTHVWTRNPSGNIIQRTAYGSNSYIDELSSDGEVMLINSGRRYLSNTAAQSINVGSSLGSSTKIDGVWYLTIGRSLLEVR